MSGFTNQRGTAAAVDFRGGTELTATDKFDGGSGAQLRGTDELSGSSGQIRGTYELGGSGAQLWAMPDKLSCVLFHGRQTCGTVGTSRWRSGSGLAG